MIGPETATIKINGKESVMYTLVIPKKLIDEIEGKTEKRIEDRDRVRIWLEPTGVKATPRRNCNNWSRPSKRRRTR